MKNLISLLFFIAFFQLSFGQISSQDDFVIEPKGETVVGIYALENDGIVVLSVNDERRSKKKYFIEVFDTDLEQIFKYETDEVPDYYISESHLDQISHQFHLTCKMDNTQSVVYTVDYESLQGHRNEIDIKPYRKKGWEIYVYSSIQYVEDGMFLYARPEYDKGQSVTNYLFYRYGKTEPKSGKLSFKADGAIDFFATYGRLRDGTFIQKWGRSFGDKIQDGECTQYLMQLDLDGEHRLIGCSGKGYNNSLAGESGFVRGKGDDDFYIIDGVRTGRDAVEGLKMVYVQSGQIVKEDYVAYKDVPNFKKVMPVRYQEELAKLNKKKKFNDHDVRSKIEGHLTDTSADGNFKWVGLMYAEQYMMYNGGGTKRAKYRMKDYSTEEFSHLIEVEFDEDGFSQTKALALPDKFNRKRLSMLKIDYEADYTQWYFTCDGKMYLVETDNEDGNPSLEEENIENVEYAGSEYGIKQASRWYGNTFGAFGVLRKYDNRESDKDVVLVKTLTFD